MAKTRDELLALLNCDSALVNLQKLLKDCMTLVGFWTDDALVASDLCEKFWAEVSGIYIKVEEL